MRTTYWELAASLVAGASAYSTGYANAWAAPGVGKRASVGPVNVPLTEWYRKKMDLQWYATISVGTPPQNFTVMIDTGSNGLMIPRANCSGCDGHAHFDPSRSSTFSAAPNIEVQQIFGTGADTVPLPLDDTSVAGANCTAVTDTLSVGGLTQTQGQFLLCHTYGDDLSDEAMDGVWGLGSSATAEWERDGDGDPDTFEYDTLFWRLVATGQLADASFSLALRPGGGGGSELTLGGSNAAQYAGDVRTVDLDRALSELRRTWVVAMPGVYVDGRVLVNASDGCASDDGVALVDSGTAYMMTSDPAITAALYAMVSPAIRPIDALGSWGAPCHVLDRVATDVTLLLGPAGGRQANITIPRRFFNLGEFPPSPGLCQALFVSPPGEARDPSGRPGWVIGGPLLKAFYTVWDGVDFTLGFAEPAVAHVQEACASSTSKGALRVMPHLRPGRKDGRRT